MSLRESTLGRAGAEGSRHGALQSGGHCGQWGEVAGFRLQKGLEGHGPHPEFAPEWGVLWPLAVMQTPQTQLLESWPSPELSDYLSGDAWLQAVGASGWCEGLRGLQGGAGKGLWRVAFFYTFIKTNRI